MEKNYEFCAYFEKTRRKCHVRVGSCDWHKVGVRGPVRYMTDNKMCTGVESFLAMKHHYLRKPELWKLSARSFTSPSVRMRW